MKLQSGKYIVAGLAAVLLGITGCSSHTATTEASPSASVPSYVSRTCKAPVWTEDPNNPSDPFWKSPRTTNEDTKSTYCTIWQVTYEDVGGGKLRRDKDHPQWAPTDNYEFDKYDKPATGNVSSWAKSLGQTQSWTLYLTSADELASRAVDGDFGMKNTVAYVTTDPKLVKIAEQSHDDPKAVLRAVPELDKAVNADNSALTLYYVALETVPGMPTVVQIVFHADIRVLTATEVPSH